MAHLLCNCGDRLSNTLCPNTLEGDLRGSYEYKDRSVWECHKCGRLAIDVKDEDGLTIVKWYIPENGEVGNLFGVGTRNEFEDYLKLEIEPHMESVLKLKMFDRNTQEIEFLKKIVEKISNFQVREAFEELEERIRKLK